MNELASLKSLAEAKQFSGEEIAWRTKTIGAQLMAESPYIRAPNFDLIHRVDIERLFDKYDQLFFDRLCRESLGTIPLSFRLSKRMTRVGGTTARFMRRTPPFDVWYEITISSTLLFQTFDDIERPVVVNGCECRHRLDALQRIMEHEMVHLVESMIWERSQCAAPRFQGIAHRLFGHTESGHHLVTQHERAAKQFGIQPGDRVRFTFEGRELSGIVNRITRRATVLVEDPTGAPYRDGRRYRKFYVPLEALAPLRAHREILTEKLGHSG